MIRYIFVLGVFLSSLFGGNGFISPSELKSSLDDENLVIIDVDERSIYKKGHIENAINADIISFLDRPINVNPDEFQNVSFKKKMLLADERVIEKELRALGINKNSKVVIYDHNTDDGKLKSAFLAFVFIYSGFDNVQILDGGYMSWVFENQILVSTESYNAKSYGNIEVKSREHLLVDTQNVKNSISKVKMLDTRSPRFYYGVLKSENIEKLGHIPRASSSYYEDKFYADGVLRENQDLKAIYFNGHNLKNDDKVIVYSDNLLNSAMEWYVLYKEMGFKNAKIYENSLLEWANKENNKLTRFKWE
jgi:thiosulfate/3-mercaptopyruvate sulfurtransferase